MNYFDYNNKKLCTYSQKMTAIPGFCIGRHLRRKKTKQLQFNNYSYKLNRNPCGNIFFFFSRYLLFTFFSISFKINNAFTSMGQLQQVHVFFSAGSVTINNIRYRILNLTDHLLEFRKNKNERRELLFQMSDRQVTYTYLHCTPFHMSESES